MTLEVTAGCILISKKHNTNKVLIINRIWPTGENTWIFPKGYQEKGETLKQTALRETTEETGYLNIKLIEGLVLDQEVFQPRPNVLKKVYWYLAELLNDEKQNLILAKGESDSQFVSHWLSFKDAIEQLSFPIQRKNLEIVERFINKKLKK